MKALFYFVDGFAWDYVEGGIADLVTKSLTDAKPLETVLGYSSSILPVLISGKLPSETGLWTEYYRDDRHPSRIGRIAGRSTIVGTPLNIVRLVAFRIARKAGRPEAHRLRIPLELSHHFKRHAIDYTRMPPCALPVPTIADICAESGLRMSFKFIGNERDTANALADARREIDDVDVFFFYDCTVDHAGHAHGPDPTVLKPFLDRVGTTLSTMREIVEPKHAFEALIFSDHGMTAIQGSFDVFAALKPLRIGHDFLAFPDSTFARFWYPSREARSHVHEALRNVPGSFLTQAEASRYGVPYPDHRYGEDVLIADEGVIFHPSYISPTFVRASFPDKGMHGYRPECSSADGVVLYSGQVMEGLPDRVPAVSVFDRMCTILAAIGE
jgi:Type I phosphodiesterase / nucleotide pyrophosphatase